MNIVGQALLVLLMVFVILMGILSLEGPLKRAGNWLDQFERDIRAIKATGADPKNLWQLYLIYRQYKKGAL